MSIFHRYIIGQIARHVGVMLVIIITLFVAVDYISNIDEFVAADFSFQRSIYVVLLKMPMVLVQLLPICGMLAILVTFGVMNRNNELVAMRSGGIGNGFLMVPVFMAAFGLSGAGLLLSEWISPVSSKAFFRIRTTEIRHTGMITTEHHNVWVRKDDRILHVRHIDTQARKAYGITSYRFDRGFRLVRRVDAREADIADSGMWELLGVTVQEFEPDRSAPEVATPPVLMFDSGIRVEDLRDLGEESDALSMAELAARIRKLESEGFDASTLRVDFAGKLAFPFTHFIFGAFAVGISARRRFREHLPLSIGIGVAAAFLFWSLFSFSLSLGHGEMLPPLVAAWGPMAAASFLAFYLLLTVDNQ